VDRHEWKLVLNVHIAESRKEAFAQARKKAGLYQQEYLEGTLGNASGFDGPADKLIDYMVEQNQWCVGTPDDLIDFIYRLDEMSGGFGGLLIQSTEWGTREQVKHSYELISRYVMPHFQDSLVNLDASQKWASRERDELQALRREALSKVQSDYQKLNDRREGH
jgi:limonene 1,2-monooxygenase